MLDVLFLSVKERESGDGWNRQQVERKGSEWRVKSKLLSSTPARWTRVELNSRPICCAHFGYILDGTLHLEDGHSTVD